MPKNKIIEDTTVQVPIYEMISFSAKNQTEK